VGIRIKEPLKLLGIAIIELIPCGSLIYTNGRERVPRSVIGEVRVNGGIIRAYRQQEKENAENAENNERGKSTSSTEVFDSSNHVSGVHDNGHLSTGNSRVECDG